jgi:glycosyltransferase involved in cell wall biosynthesis
MNQELQHVLAPRELGKNRHRFVDGTTRSADPVPSQERREYRRAKVVCVGFLPPPIDGQRVITTRMFDRLAGLTTVARLDLGRFRGLGLMSKPLSTLAVCLELVGKRFSGYSRLYLAPHSGAGLVYSCCIVMLGRALGYRLFVHYHSYKNLAAYSSLMRVFLALCGDDATHIVLAPPMQRDLQKLYRAAKRVRVLSNAIFIPQHAIRREFGGRPLRVGHVSNLSKDKGVVAVIECMRQLHERCPEIELVLAGPAEDPEIKDLLNNAFSELGGKFTYLGGLTGDQVKEFYEHIDVFLFPTLYEHEAEPLVLLEAVSLGVPAIATDRGCISYLLGPNCGLVVDAAGFVEGAVEKIANWTLRRDELAQASDRARARFLELRRETEPQLERLLLSISSAASR